jgi:hypothetical protein
MRPVHEHALRTLIDRAAAQAQVEIEIVVQANSMSLQKQPVMAGRSCQGPASLRMSLPAR